MSIQKTLQSNQTESKLLKKQETFKKSVRKTLSVRAFLFFKIIHDPSKQTSSFYIYYFTPV